MEDVLNLSLAPDAVAECRARAEDGDPEAQLELARRLEFGIGLPADAQRAWDWLAKAAHSGLPEAQYRLGRAMRGAAAGPEERPGGLAWLIKAAQAGHGQARWELVRIYRTGDGVARDRGSVYRWLRTLVQAGDPHAHTQLSQDDPEGYKRLAQPLRWGERAALPMNAPGRFDGFLTRVSVGRWTVSSGERTLEVDPGTVSTLQAKVGRRIELWGRVEAGRLLAMLAEIPEPRYEYSAKLRRQDVVAGQAQSWTVDVSVVNRGEQPIKAVTLDIRCAQQQSPNSERELVTLRDIPAGGKRETTVEFEFYNYQYIGLTSLPKVEASLHKLEW